MQSSRVLILSRLGSQVFIGKKHHNVKVLSMLFDLKEDTIVLLDPDAEEVECNNGYFNLNHTKYYTIVTQQDIDEEEDIEPTDEEKRVHVTKVEQIRRDFIRKTWCPLHPWLYNLTEKHMNPNYLKFINSYTSTHNSQLLSNYPKKLTDTGIYLAQLFSEEFCRDLIEEINAIEDSDLPLIRPNSMNSYGTVLGEFGLDSVWNELLDKYIRDLISILYPNYGPYLDHHHTFIVKYNTSEQTGLGFHYDDSEVTLNLCLGKEFVGGDLYFQGILSDPTTHNENFIYHHERGKAIFHLGQHRHGAMPITEGTRYNLIIWYKASKYRLQSNCV